MIEPDDNLLYSMMNKHVLTHEKMVAIRNLSDEYKKNDELIDWLVNNYNGISCTIFELLEKAGQRHIINYIKANGRMFCCFTYLLLHQTTLLRVLLSYNSEYFTSTCNPETFWFFSFLHRQLLMHVCSSLRLLPFLCQTTLILRLLVMKQLWTTAYFYFFIIKDALRLIIAIVVQA